jgi:hypothetical protein
MSRFSHGSEKAPKSARRDTNVCGSPEQDESSM